MPLLNYGRPDNWELVTSLSKGQIFILRQFIFDAKKKFKYKDDRLFLKTLKPNMDEDRPIIYYYDSSSLKKEDPLYIDKLKELIAQSNVMMTMSDSKKFKNFAFDIKGTWDNGAIVLMKRRGTNDDLTAASKRAIIKRYQDANIIPKSTFTSNIFK